MSRIRGLKLRARDEEGKEKDMRDIEIFFSGERAFGIDGVTGSNGGLYELYVDEKDKV